MDWTAYVDGYCERLGPGLWAEPVNDLSELAFLLVAGVVWWRGGRVFAALAGLVFVAGVLFHLTAMRWGAVADSVSLLLFAGYTAAVFPRAFFGREGRRVPAFAVGGFVVVTVLATALGGGLYLSSLVGLGVGAGVLAYARSEYWTHFAVAGAVFALALALRGIDRVVCGDLPVGTHFLWHLLAAVTLYVVSNAVTSKEKAPSPE